MIFGAFDSQSSDMNIPYKTNLYRDLKVLAGFTILAVVMRFFSFFPAIISHDEGTYLVIAREIFLGKTYFVDIIDTKPIGIFIILGLFIKFISSSIFIIRLFAAFVIAVTSFIIYKISLYDQSERKPAIIAGALFIFMLSIFTFFGVFINAEIFYTFFTVLAFYIFIRASNTVSYLIPGILLGIGFIIKYSVLFDLAGWLIYAFFAVVFTRNLNSIRRIFLNCLTAFAGFLIPFAIEVLYYYKIGHLNDLMFYTFGATSRIPVERTLLSTLIYVGDFHLRFLPAVFFFYYALFRSGHMKIKPRINNGLIITWCIFVLIAIVTPGKPFGHYFIQMMVPVSIVAGRFFNSGLIKPGWVNRIIRYPAAAFIVAVLMIGNVFLQKHDYFDKPDLTKQVAKYLTPQLKPGDMIYTGNFQAVLYYLLEKECPVKYVHRSLLCDPRHRETLRIDLESEMEALMSKEPDYIIMWDSYCYEPMNDFLENNYKVIAIFDDEIRVFKKY